MSETEHIYRVKQKIGPFKFFVRKGFKPLQFYSFYSVVKYVVDSLHETIIVQSELNYLREQYWDTDSLEMRLSFGDA